MRPILALSDDRDARIVEALRAADTLREARDKAAGNMLPHGSKQGGCCKQARLGHNAEEAVEPLRVTMLSREPSFLSTELAAVSALRAAHNADVVWTEHAQLWEYQRVRGVLAAWWHSRIRDATVVFSL